METRLFSPDPINSKKMNDQKKLVVFRVADQQFALELSAVEKAVRIVEVSPLPKSPEHILGIINYHGEIIPVINIRMLFNLPEREIELTDKLLIAQTSLRTPALWIDSVSEVIEIANDDIIKSEKIFLGVEFVKSIFKLDNGIVFISDLDQFLTDDEISLLIAALDEQKEKGKVIKQKRKEKPKPKLIIKK